MTTIHTIGHSRQSAERFVSLLRRHGIERVVDVRSRPYSRWAPHFRKSELAGSLAANGIDYVFLGQELGGRPEGEEYYDSRDRVDYQRRARALDFLAGLERLVELAREKVTAILCAEGEPRRCHRRTLIAPELVRWGIPVLHILPDGSALSDDQLPGEAQLSLLG
jgi:uncharacterized protein (DUF488 family)